MDRIGLTTVVFRNRFKSTLSKNVVLENELVLKDIPEYFADRFGIHNVELWSKHFELKSPEYIHDIKKRLKKNKSTLIDIQVDTKNDLSDPDEEIREKAVLEMKEWIDIGAEMGTKFIRISPMKKSYEKAILSVREVNNYAKTKGISALVENHMDIFSKVENHINIRKDIADNNFGLLADFGNYPNDVDQIEALKQIAPYTRLISAKAKDFNDQMMHFSYDFGKCVEIFESIGYNGIYSLEQWGNPDPGYDYEKITDWMIMEVKDHLKEIKRI
jgi:sugar phosphate isomerase/epimerase